MYACTHTHRHTHTHTRTHKKKERERELGIIRAQHLGNVSLEALGFQTDLSKDNSDRNHRHTHRERERKWIGLKKVEAQKVREIRNVFVCCLMDRKCNMSLRTSQI